MLRRLIGMAAVLLLAPGALGSTTSVPTLHAAGAASGSPGSQTLLTMSCPSVTDCYTGGTHGALLATHDGGTTWQAQSWQSEFRQSATTIVSIACSSAEVCSILTQAGCGELGAHVPVLHTSDGGSHWGATSIQGCGTRLACPQSSTCYTAVFPTGEGLPAFMRTTDGGKSWQRQATISPNRVDASLACPAPTTCYVAFQNALGRSTDAGAHWALHRITGKPCAPFQSNCPGFSALACPGASICYAGGGVLQNGREIAEVVTTTTGFRSQASHLIPGLDNVTGLSCPTQSVCFALGSPDTSRFAVTRDGGKSWRVGRITSPYPFDALSCPSVSVCYAAGFLGRLVRTRDGGATWHDLLPAIFVSGTYGAGQPQHTYSPPFTATGPWQLAVGKQPGPLGPGGKPLPASCAGVDTVTVYVRNSQNQIVAGPIKAPGRLDRVNRSTVRVTGKLRLDVVSRCSSFSVRVDGVARSTARW